MGNDSSVGKRDPKEEENAAKMAVLITWLLAPVFIHVVSPPILTVPTPCVSLLQLQTTGCRLGSSGSQVCIVLAAVYLGHTHCPGHLLRQLAHVARDSWVNAFPYISHLVVAVAKYHDEKPEWGGTVAAAER